MNSSEHVAYKYLLSRFSTVVYEPDGNIPPDFLADGRVAVEVRRLNQNKSTSGEDRGLEETAIPFRMGFRKLLESLGPPTSDKSWFVSFRFQRPVDSWKALCPIIKGKLLAFRDNPTHESESISVATNFELNVFRASKIYSTCFLPAGYVDRDSGGWLLAETLKNLKLCINEKTRKVAEVRHKYPEWWLVLIDLINYGLDDFDRDMLHDQLREKGDWEKIVLIDPRTHERAFEI